MSSQLSTDLADFILWLMKQPICREAAQDDYVLAGPTKGGDSE